jgi:phage FluMu protein Com
MDIKELPIHTIFGGLTTDYFGFYCDTCKKRMDPLEFLGLVHHTPTFRLKCPKCKEIYVFKMDILKGREFMKENVYLK